MPDSDQLRGLGLMRTSLTVCKCDTCGAVGPTVTHAGDQAFCAMCLDRDEGYMEGRRDAAELMLHVAIAGARAVMRSDDEVRRVFEFVMAGGEPMFRVDGVGS